MAKLSFEKKDIPFLLAGTGTFSVDTANFTKGKPLDEAAPVVLTTSFNADSEKTIALGQDNTVRLGVSTTASAQVTPVFSSSTGSAVDLLTTYEVGHFFDNGANSDKVVLVFDVGGSADATASGSFLYSALKAGFTIDANVNGAYTYLRALDKTLPVEQLLPKFFQTMRLPEQGQAAPEAGEAISLRYGGYLKLSAEASAGYELAGTKSVALGQLALSEKYDLSILGKVGLSAAIAGQFSIIVTAADGLSGWARVCVKRSKSRKTAIAADVNVGFKNSLDNLPPTADEFLGAALGINALNFLTIFQKARQLSNFEKFKATIDGLAQQYIAEYIGKGFDELAKETEFTAFLARVNQVVTSYQEVGNRSIALFDRYFDQLAALEASLEKIRGLNAEQLATFRKDLDAQLWNILSQLTDGDAFGFLVGETTIDGQNVPALPAIQSRASAALELIRNKAHEEIRKAVTLAKQGFGLDKFMGELSKLDTMDELKAVATGKTGLFVTRLVGRTLDSSGNIKQAFNEVHAVLDKIDTFKNKLFAAFKEASRSSYQIALHAQYSRSSESDALVDVLINVAEDRGKVLLSEAGKGDFENTLATADTNVVRLRQGVFTHRTRRESAFKVNIIGWHLNYNYEGFDRVITETEQRLVPSERGITVLTTAELGVERDRKRQNEETHLNFLLRALGESAKAVPSNEESTAYLIDSLNSMTARYELSYTDDDTSAAELDDYVAFARDLGLDKKGATLDALDALLPRAANGGFGAVQTSYDVRFGEKAISALLSVKQISAGTEQAIRNAMRQMVLSNYLKSDEMHDVAFAYATDGVFRNFEEKGFAAFTNQAPCKFPVRLSGSSIAAPAEVSLDRMEMQVLTTLFMIENSMIDELKNLTKVLKSSTGIDPMAFQKRLEKFGSVLKDFDDFDQTSSKHGVGTNTIFAMFDMLARMASSGSTATASMLRLSSQAGGKSVEKVFLSDEAAEVNAPTLAAASGG